MRVPLDHHVPHGASVVQLLREVVLLAHLPISSSCDSSQSACSSSLMRMPSSSSREPLSPTRDARLDARVEAHDSLPSRRRGRARTARATVSPTLILSSRCMLGTPSRKRMRVDQLVGVLHLVDRLVRGCTRRAGRSPSSGTSCVCMKYWLTAVSSDGENLVQQFENLRITMHERRAYETTPSLAREHDARSARTPHRCIPRNWWRRRRSSGHRPACSRRDGSLSRSSVRESPHSGR